MIGKSASDRRDSDNREYISWKVLERDMSRHHWPRRALAKQTVFLCHRL
jgi:hypothetical protein